jgi:plastocyanin
MWKVWPIAGSRQHRLWWINLLAVAFFSLVVPAFGDDQPVVMVRPNTLVPQHIEVHVGELIRWRAAGGEHLHLQLDAHPNAHEAVVRSGEIRAVFLVPGVHTYEVLIMSDGRRALTGTVTVKEAQGAVDLPRTCGPGSSTEICFEP